MKKILVIGAGGGVGSVLVKRIQPVLDDCRMTLTDIDPDRIPGQLIDAHTMSEKVNLFDAPALSTMIREHDVVLHCAGPFRKTALPVAELCTGYGKDYLDLCDDIEALDGIASLHEKAVREGSRLLIGAGVSPGFTNVFAADLVALFNRVEVLDVAWLSGDEGGVASGEAVLDHVLQIAGGSGVRWNSGVEEPFESYTIPSTFQLGGNLGDRVLYEVAHPEPVMLARTFPDIPLIRCFGVIDPPAVGAIVRGIARAVQMGGLKREEALGFMKAASEGKIRSPGAWLPALSGILEGIGSGMIGSRDILSFAGYLSGRHEEFAGGIACRATGTIGGERQTLTLRSNQSGPGTFIDSMTNATGTCAAAFTLLLVADALEPGVRFTEELPSRDVYRAMEKLGFNTDELIECA